MPLLTASHEIKKFNYIAVLEYGFFKSTACKELIVYTYCYILRCFYIFVNNKLCYCKSL